MNIRKKMRDLAASNKEYKILYYNKLHDYDVLKQESQMDDSIDLGLKPPPGVTCKDLLYTREFNLRIHHDIGY